jgi:hypothetical protein
MTLWWTAIRMALPHLGEGLELSDDTNLACRCKSMSEINRVQIIGMAACERNALWPGAYRHRFP